MSGQTNQSCQLRKGAPEFIFASSAVQTAANTVYESKKAFDANPVNSGKNQVYRFKSDFERMQYKLGLYGRTSTGNA